MNFSITKHHTSGFVILVSLLALILAPLAVFSRAFAAGSDSASDHLITIHDRGIEKSVISSKNNLREVFSEAGIILDDNDIVEPGLDEELVAKSYQVNVYRARPVIIEDGMAHTKVMSAYQTPKQVAEHAGLTLRDEDKTSMSLTDDFVADGASLRMVIDRATPLSLVLYGKKETVYTQGSTVADFLKEKNITLASKDHINVKPDTMITENMSIEIWREGKQTITKEEKLNFTVKQIQDTDRPVGYKKVTTVGVPGKKLVTYRVVVKNGKIVKKKAIQTVVTKKAVQQVEIVGAKPSFSGDFAAALAKLRSCEGGYDSWNPAGPYYGAYQFNEGTWNSVTDAPYGSATPAQQDEAARKLYERRGWQPWPVCGASLPDTYR
ncbi:MAG TPA: ubiquitin-like domain-containing protein [Candidatus Saccharimonadales bacterium]